MKTCGMCGEPDVPLDDAGECEECAGYRSYYASLTYGEAVEEEKMIARHVEEAERRGY